MFDFRVQMESCHRLNTYGPKYILQHLLNKKTQSPCQFFIPIGTRTAKSWFIHFPCWIKSTPLCHGFESWSWWENPLSHSPSANQISTPPLSSSSDWPIHWQWPILYLQHTWIDSDTASSALSPVLIAFVLLLFLRCVCFAFACIQWCLRC